MVPTEARTVQRIHILGAAGSGKTTLARQCAERLNCPWYELDTIGYEDGHGRKRTLEERLQSIGELRAQPAWVTEGAFLWWIDELLDAADAVVWLDLPWTVSMPRIITRHFKLSWAGENRHPGLWKLTKFVWWCRRYYMDKEIQVPEDRNDDGAVNRATVTQYLDPFMAKVVHCRTPDEVERLLAGLDCSKP